MSIAFYPNNEIDRERWDQCLDDCSLSLIYARSWWLDIVSPGWTAIAGFDENILFPLPVRKKIGIEYSFQPAFTQQLGIFSKEVIPDISPLIERIPYKFFEINLNETNVVQPVKDLEVTPRRNALLNLNRPYLELKENFSSNHKRNLDKKEKGKVTTDADTDQIISLFRDNRGADVDLTDVEFGVLRKIFAACSERKLLLSFGYEMDQKLVAGAVLVKSGSRLIFLFSGQNPVGRDNRGLFRIIDYIIRENAGSSQILDFEGSNDPGLMRFYLGFGSDELVYLHIKRNRLPPLIRLLKK